MVVDTDVVARQVVAPGGAAHDALVRRFGPALAADRRALAGVVFSDPEALADLNAIVHPAVREEVGRRLAELRERDADVVVLAVPLLVETGGAYGVAAVVVVDCPEEVAVRRLVEQRGMDEADVRRRMAAQASRDERTAAADVIIHNEGSPGRPRVPSRRDLGVDPGARRAAPSRTGDDPGDVRAGPECHQLVRRQPSRAGGGARTTTQSGRATRSSHVKRTTRHPAASELGPGWRRPRRRASRNDGRRLSSSMSTGRRVGDVGSPDPGLVVADVELADGLGQPGLPDEVAEPGLELAGGRDVALGALGEQPAHDGRALASPAGEVEKGRLQRPGCGDAHGQAVVDRPLGLAGMEDAGEIAQRAGHPGGHDALDHREVVRGKGRHRWTISPVRRGGDGAGASSPRRGRAARSRGCREGRPLSGAMPPPPVRRPARARAAAAPRSAARPAPDTRRSRSAPTARSEVDV